VPNFMGVHMRPERLRVKDRTQEPGPDQSCCIGTPGALRSGRFRLTRADTTNSKPPIHPSMEPIMSFSLPPLPYAYDALAPYMSAETLQFHHDKHHQAYVDNGNKLAGDGTKYAGKSIEAICVEAFMAKDMPVVNNIGQHYNHIHFWSWMKPNGGGKKIPGKLQKLVDAHGGFDKVRSDFVQAGVTQFGSGWCWLAIKNGKLEVMKTPNGENPLMHGAQPILGCDVWEHSYYIDYRNLRPKYLEAFIDSLVNWDYVEQMAGKA
jgi:Fe-Mn family superoxide dismutase